MIARMRKADYADWPRIAGLIFAFCLLFVSAGEASLPEMRIPSEYGTVKEVSDAQPATQGAERMIIHIQDAHCNYEAQKNLAKVLDYLAKEHNLKLIMVEGGSGNVSLSFLRAYSDKKTREEIADKYLQRGKISGEEYLDMTSDYNLELYGIEDEALYDAHLSNFGKLDSLRQEGLRYLEGAFEIVNNLKSFIYSQELKGLEEKEKAYQDKTVSLVQYCQLLKEMAAQKGLNLKDWPQLTGFCETARLEKELDFKQAELERNNFIKDLAQLLSEKDVNELIKKSQEFKAKNITPEEYYSYLKAKASPLDLKQNYPQLNAYMDYIALSKDIKAPGLLKEVNLIVERIKETCLNNAEQRRLSEISQSLEILKRLLNLEMTPQDYAYFKENKPQFFTASWRDFLSQGCSQYNLAMPVSTSSLIDENLNLFETFYQLGILREEAFIKNMAKKMEESGEKLGVLITGGFHTPGVTQMLKEKGYSYLVVAPAITKKSDSSFYFSVLRGEKGRRKNKEE